MMKLMRSTVVDCWKNYQEIGSIISVESYIHHIIHIIYILPAIHEVNLVVL